MFPSFNNQNKNTSNLFNNNNYNYNSNNTLLKGNNDQAHQSQVKLLLGFSYESQNDEGLIRAIQILEHQNKQILLSLQNFSKVQANMMQDDQFSKQIRERCSKIKRDNEIIAMEMLNFKDQISKLKANSLEKDLNKEQQFNNVQQRIRRTKMDISAKLQKIRNNRKASKSKQGEKKNTNYVNTVKLALTELRDATKVVNHELLKTRQQIKVLIKQLYDETI